MSVLLICPKNCIKINGYILDNVKYDFLSSEIE